LDVQIDTFVLGPFQTNSYVVRAGGDCWVIDPGFGPDPLIHLLRDGAIEPSKILLTHGHADHIGGVEAVRSAFPGARVCCPAGDAEMLTSALANLSAMFGLPFTVGAPDEVIDPGGTLELGPTRWQVLDSSGHTPGGVSFYCPAAGAVFSGDALFAGGIGRVDLPGAGASRLIGNISVNLLPLPDDIRVLPGHGPESTIGAERRTNPFLTGGQNG